MTKLKRYTITGVDTIDHEDQYGLWVKDVDVEELEKNIKVLAMLISSLVKHSDNDILNNNATDYLSRKCLSGESKDESSTW